MAVARRTQSRNWRNVAMNTSSKLRAISLTVAVGDTFAQWSITRASRIFG
jgi:hypothetical protein